MKDIAAISVEGGIGIVTVDFPPVNALAAPVRRAVVDAIRTLAEDVTTKAIVLMCAGRTFFAGADIKEFGKPWEAPDFHALTGTAERCPKPIVVAIHGTAFGGGLELALACHFRVAASSAQVGLPEVTLGLLPGAGGTQRVPRLIGVEPALELMTSGKPLKAGEAYTLGLIDQVVPDDELRKAAIAAARRLADEGLPPRLARDMQDKVVLARGKPEIFSDFRKARADAFRGFKAPENIIKAVEAAVDLTFDEGIKREAELVNELIYSSESAAQRHAFFAERMTTKIPDIGSDTKALSMRNAAVVGRAVEDRATIWGLVDAGIHVAVFGDSPSHAVQVLNTLRAEAEQAIAAGRLAREKSERRLACISLGDFSQSLDVVIVGALDQAEGWVGEVSKLIHPRGIVALTGEGSDLRDLKWGTADPAQVIGWQLPKQPASRLVEVVRGPASRKEAVVTALELAKRLRKVPVVRLLSGSGIVERLQWALQDGIGALLKTGVGLTTIERLLRDFGIDVSHSAIAASVSNSGTVVRLGTDTEETGLLARMLYSVADEGTSMLNEGIVFRASDIDVAAILAAGWPIYKGGPMFWAEHIGLSSAPTAPPGEAANVGGGFGAQDSVRS